MPPIENKPVVIGAPWTYRHVLEEWDDDLDEWVPLEGIPMNGYFSATPDGGSIHADLIKSMNERVAGDYVGPLPSVDKDAHLLPYVDGDVYEVHEATDLSYRKIRRRHVARNYG